MSLLGMGREELLLLKPEEVKHSLTPHDVVHIARALGAFWSYDYEAAKCGRVGMHALLKSGLHSDGFFVSKILLAHENIRKIISDQMVRMLRSYGVTGADYVAGVPDGATKLGEDVAEMFGARNAVMQKIDGNIVLITPLTFGSTILLVEVFTRGTGFAEAVRAIQKNSTQAHILPCNPVIINRGGEEIIVVNPSRFFYILPIVEWRVKDWEPALCPLCEMGSVPVKPKATEANWRAIITSQL